MVYFSHDEELEDLVLSNQGIHDAMVKGEIGVTPFYYEQLGACSYDVTLGAEYCRVIKKSKYLDLCNFDEEYTRAETADRQGRITVNPGECILAITQEEIYLGPDMSAQVHSKSSLGRLFQTMTAGGAGFCDAGFKGHVTLEIYNFSPRPVIYTAGMLIAQLTFMRLDSDANPCYDMKGQYSNALAAPIPAKRVKFGGAHE